MAKRSKSPISRLCLAMHKSLIAMKPYREHHKQAVRQFAGANWSDDGSENPVPINLISLYTDVVSRTLIANNPRAMYSTFRQQARPVVRGIQDWFNQEVKDIRLAETLRRVVINALFSLGICKVGIADPGEAGLSADGLEAGTPYARSIDLDDFVWDMHARDKSQVQFIGHRIRVPLDTVRDSPRYHKSRKDLEPSEDPPFNASGDERIGMMGRGYVAQGDEYQEMIDLWEVYDPQRKAVYTLTNDQVSGGGAYSEDDGEMVALLEQPWRGPYCGPYHILAFSIVPGNLMPKGKIADLVDLHMNINQMTNKLFRQAKDQKNVGFASGPASADGTRIIEANDGDIIRCDHPKDVVFVNMNGPNRELMLMAADAISRFSWVAGNLDIMGGLSAQSKTATQDTMLNENASRAIASMQDATITFTSDVIESLSWLWYHHPEKVMRSNFQIPGQPDIERAVYPKFEEAMQPMLKRDIPWEELRVEIAPYSLSHQTPQQRAKMLVDVVTQVYTPLAQIAMQQGTVLDFAKFLTKIGELTDDPDIVEIMNISEPVQPEGDMKTQQPAPQETTHVRENMPGRTQQGNTMNLMNALMDVNPGGAPSNGQLQGTMQ